jgi:hypothetical protein
VQVPLHAGAACSTAIKPGQEQLELLLRTAAVRVLQAILHTEHSAGLFKLQLAAQDTSNNLAVSMLQQLQDAGLMQQLPVLLSNSAKDFRDALATQTDGSAMLHAAMHAALLDKAANMLSITEHVIQLHRGLPTVLHAHAVLAPAAVGLIATVMRYISAHLPNLQQHQQQPHQQPSSQEQEQQYSRRVLLLTGTAMVLAADEYVATLGRSFSAFGSIPDALDAVPQLQQLLDSPDWVPFLVLQLAMVSQGLLVQQPLQELRAAAAAEEGGSRRGRQMQRTRGRSSGSGSSGNSSSGVDAFAAAEGDLPLKLVQQLQAQHRLPPNTPCQQRLFELLGVDSITLAWASQRQHVPHSTDYFQGLLRLYQVVMEQQQQQQQQQQGEEQHKGAATQCLLHLLLPAVLLPCAAQLCKPGSAAAAARGLSTADQARLCSNIAAGTFTDLQVWRAHQGIASSSSTPDELQLWLGELRSLLLLVLHQVLLAMAQQQQQQQQRLVPHEATRTTTPAAAAAATPAIEAPDSQDDWNEAAASLIAALMLLLAEQEELDAHVRWQDAIAAVQQRAPASPAVPGESSANCCSAAAPHHQQQQCSAQGGVPARGVRRAVPPALCVSAQLPFLCNSFERLVRMQAAAIAAGGLDAYSDDVEKAVNLVGSGCSSSNMPGAPGLLTTAAQHAGLGQEGGRQYYSLLCSLLKLGYCVSRHAVLQLGVMWSPIQPAVAAFDCIQLEAGQGALGTSLPDALPSVFIIGRCCLLWADILSAQAADGRVALQECVQLELRCCVHQYLTLLCHAAKAWLSARSAQLSAAGYPDPDGWLQLLLAAKAAAEAAAAARQVEAVASQCAALVGELRAFGRASCVFAVPLFCNNPRCMSLQAETEVGLVSGRACVCSGCRVARYCGRECLRQHWKQHKPVCKGLAAAAAAVPDGAGAPGML